MKLSQAIKEVIALAEAIRTYWDTELPKRHPDYPLVHPGEDSGPPPPEKKKLHDLLAKLPKGGIYKIALVMRLGQGYFRTNNLPRHFAELKKTLGTPAQVALQLVENAALADYLMDGLAELEKAGIDVDPLPVTPVKTVR